MWTLKGPFTFISVIYFSHADDCDKILFLFVYFLLLFVFQFGDDKHTTKIEWRIEEEANKKSINRVWNILGDFFSTKNSVNECSKRGFYMCLGIEQCSLHFFSSFICWFTTK